MRIIIGVRREGSPDHTWEYDIEWSFRWPCVPRLGDLFVSPNDETDEGIKVPPRTYEIQRIWWLPLDVGDEDPAIRVDVEELR